MDIPWKRIAACVSLALGSAAKELYYSYQNEKMMKDIGQSIGKEVLKTVNKNKE